MYRSKFESSKILDNLNLKTKLFLISFHREKILTKIFSK